MAYTIVIKYSKYHSKQNIGNTAISETHTVSQKQLSYIIIQNEITQAFQYINIVLI